MKITLLTYGSMGDVLPYVALALGLKDRGYDVLLVEPTNFEAYITEFGISYSKIHGDSKEILESEQGRKWLSSGNAKQFMKMVDTISHDMRHELNHDIAKAYENADAIITHNLTLNRALIMSERYGIPLMVGYLFPVFPSTREFA